MDSRALRTAITVEMGSAMKEHNPVAELLELEHHLEMQLTRVQGLLRATIRKPRKSR